MRIAIRADASRRIGTGHVMRCLTLADALRARGDEVTFLTRDAADGGAPAIAARGFAVVRIPAQPGYESTWLGASEAFDAAHCERALRALGYFDWLVVDQYALGAQWERAVRSRAEGIFAIDDLADRAHDCDVLLDTTWRGPDCDERYATLIPPQARRLLGPSYALLRPEFAGVARRARDGAVRRLVVFFGGADPDDLTGRALDALQGHPALRALEVDAIVGGANARAAALTARAGERLRVHVETPHVAELLGAADLALGAGGTSTWERAWLGVPALVVAIAENQREVVRAIAAAGAAWDLGWHEDLDAPALAAALLRACADPASLRALSRQALIMMGHGPLGTERVADALAACGSAA